MLKFASFSEIGPREENQDRILSPAPIGDGFLMAIADGVGGATGGDKAAEIAVEVLKSSLQAHKNLPAAFAEISEIIRSEGAKNSFHSKMATTLTAVLISPPQLRLAHVGDARAYHLRGAGLVTLTQDQTEIAELVRKGILSKRQALRYSRKNVLISAIGAQSTYDLYETETKVAHGDRILLLTDGVYDRVSKGEISQISLQSSTPDHFAEALKSAVQNGGPRDNYSALVVQI
ncbi:PP2C family protein-serine/threonine phosphatase [Methylorubrum extorquens]|uniref:Protein serine/threonine phosphatase n=1 Tax=Methylorubrum extorquens DSM 13060 TaxID=882800 RepID=H1KE84_METEX|nr:protein phosphatase 2C domain-containing protein [Methylorubrum extorquens]EHP94201.1 protein serine/threonine phosphatase [Methylorubrum extorquens DSM 13060]